MATSFDRRALLCGGCSVLATACGLHIGPVPAPLDTGEDDTDPTDPGTVDEYPCGQDIDPAGAGWIPLDLADYPDLEEVGGWYVLGNVIVAHALEGCYVAIDRACTHEGVPVNYVPERAQFVCPRHGAVYDLQGDKVAGPQPRGLSVYACGRVGDTVWYRTS